MGIQVEIRQPYTKELTKLNKKDIFRTEITRVTMDFKSTIFIFGVALIFVLPLAISSPISGAVGGYEHTSSTVCHGENYFAVKNTLAAAVSACNADQACGCIQHWEGTPYYLYKGTDANYYYDDYETWVS